MKIKLKKLHNDFNECSSREDGLQKKCMSKIITKLKSKKKDYKFCGICKQEKHISEFHKNGYSKNGTAVFHPNCRICRTKVICIKSKNLSQEGKNRRNLLTRMRYKNLSIEEKKEHNRRKYKWIKEHPERRKIIYKKWQQKNMDKLCDYMREKRKSDPNFRIKERLRARIRAVLKRKTKSMTTVELMGCPIEFLRKHIESQFTPNMSWINTEKWHIDHIRPCASFDLSDPEQQKICFHYTNLQPLWAKDNMAKWAKLYGQGN